VLRVLFAYQHSAEDILTQSGRPYSILQQLRARAHVTNLSPLDLRIRALTRPAEIAFSAFGHRYSGDRERVYLRWLAWQVERAAAANACDVVFSPGSQAVSRMRSDIPIVFCADAPFGALVDFYEGYSSIADRYRRCGFRQEADAHARCAAAIYPSRWAADIAMKLHGAAPARTHVIPFGANIRAASLADIDEILDARTAAPIRVLFIGREWARKGGDLTVEACRQARRAGLDLFLHVVGVGQDIVPAEPWIVAHGVLRKGDAAERATLERLLFTCHVFFVPSRAEAYGMAFCEAAAWAMPSLTTAVGGIGAIVRDGVTGWTLAPDAAPSTFAEKLIEMTSDRDRYRAMAWQARREYESRLNWPAFADRLVQVFEAVCR
jgi:glycosyltransferase involved in cell wall biosynthesis